MTDLEQKSFDDIKRAISQDNLLSYPDLNIRFDIHTDHRNYQLGGVIRQNGKPIALYGQKLSVSQTRYTVTEKELIIIVETLKEFRTILLGQRLKFILTMKI